MVLDDDDPDDEARQILEREMAERQAAIDHAETLEWCKRRNAARQTVPVDGYERPARRSAQPADNGAAWATWSARQLAKRDRVHREHVANLAESLRHQLRKRDAEIAELRTELRELRNEIAVAKRLDEITNRLNGLETAPRSAGLRAV